MSWVDHANYFGPDRRRKSGGLRVREHRRYDYAGNPPPLSTALRQLRMRVLDASGPGVDAFIARARMVAHLADIQHEPETADVIRALTTRAAQTRGDVRQSLYAGLDRAQAALRYA
jgi:hypothetical protein